MNNNSIVLPSTVEKALESLKNTATQFKRDIQSQPISPTSTEPSLPSTSSPATSSSSKVGGETVLKKPLPLLGMEYITLNKEQLIRVGGSCCLFDSFVIALYPQVYHNYNQQERATFVSLVSNKLFDEVSVDQWLSLVDEQILLAVSDAIQKNIYDMYCRRETFLLWTTCVPLIPFAKLDIIFKNFTSFTQMRTELPNVMKANFPFVDPTDVTAQIGETVNSMYATYKRVFTCLPEAQLKRMLIKLFNIDIIVFDKEVSQYGPPISKRVTDCVGVGVGGGEGGESGEGDRKSIVFYKNENRWELIVPSVDEFQFSSNSKSLKTLCK
jgi:hypothetical protein